MEYLDIEKLILARKKLKVHISSLVISITILILGTIIGFSSSESVRSVLAKPLLFILLFIALETFIININIMRDVGRFMGKKESYILSFQLAAFFTVIGVMIFPIILFIESGKLIRNNKA